jgi:hypothetical protein
LSICYLCSCISQKTQFIIANTLPKFCRLQKKKAAETLLMPKASAYTSKTQVGQPSTNSISQKSDLSTEKTWKLKDFQELDAIKKKSIKKEDVGLKPPHYIQKNGFGTSSRLV